MPSTFWLQLMKSIPLVYTTQSGKKPDMGVVFFERQRWGTLQEQGSYCQYKTYPTMNHFSRKKFLAAAVGLSLVVPALSFAAPLTASQLGKVTSLLESFGVASTTVTMIEHVLSARVASSTPQGLPPGQAGKAVCVALTRNLGEGSSGDDVKKLQELLAANATTTGFTALPTGFFGHITARAMARFQMMHGIASTTTGYVGPLTRGFFERRCGLGLGMKDAEDKNERGKSATSTRPGPGMMRGRNGDDDSETDN